MAFPKAKDSDGYGGYSRQADYGDGGGGLIAVAASPLDATPPDFAAWAVDAFVADPALTPIGEIEVKESCDVYLARAAALQTGARARLPTRQI